MQGLIEFDRESSERKDPFPRKCARRLANTLRKNNKAGHQIDFISWEKQFEQLLDDKSQEEVTRVLDWYLDKIPALRPLPAQSAKTFRMKFNQIKGMMDKDPTIPISETAQKIMDEFKGKNWPGNSEVILPSVIQKTLDEYTRFLGEFRQLYQKLDKAQKDTRDPKKQRHYARLFRLAKWIQDMSFITGPRSFTEKWIQTLHQKVKGWQSWSGSFSTMVFSRDSQVFLAMGRSWAYDYAHECLLWDALMKEMG